MNELKRFVLIGNWSAADRAKLHSAQALIGLALAEVLHLPADEAYNSVFGGIKYVVSYSLQPDGYVDKFAKDRISFHPGRITVNLIIHEHGHWFALHNKGPMQVLTRQGIFLPNGDFLTGTHPFGYYLRHGGRHAPANGYRSDDWHDGFQLHPLSMKDSDNASEDWADMFMNWVLDSFADNEAGRTLDTWVTDYMVEWCEPTNRK